MSWRDTFDRVLGALHRAALDETFWPSASALIEEACGATGNGLVFGESLRGGHNIYFAQFHSRGQRRQDLEREYFNFYYPIDERPPRLRKLPDSQVAYVPNLYTDEELRKSPVYNEGLPRIGNQNGLDVRLDGPNGGRIVFGLGNPVGPNGWESDQITILQSLLPHIRQFVGVRQALAVAGTAGSSLLDLLCSTGIAVIHLDRQGRIANANDLAREILRGKNGLWDQGGILRAWLPSEDDYLRRLIAGALPTPDGKVEGASMRIRHPLASSGYALHVHPVTVRELGVGALGLGAMVLIVDLENQPAINPRIVAEVQT